MQRIASATLPAVESFESSQVIFTAAERVNESDDIFLRLLAWVIYIYIWVIYGLYMGYIWVIYGLYMAYIWVLIYGV